MRLLDPAGDDVRAELQRTRILHGLLGCIALWAAGGLGLASGMSWAGAALFLSFAPWAWGVLAFIRMSREPRPTDWSPGLLLAVFALPAAAPLAFTTLGYAITLVSSVTEALPDRRSARDELMRQMGDYRTESLTWVYRTHRPLDSLSVSLFQFSVSDPEEGREFLRARGFAPGDGALKALEAGFHPKNFPVAWLPFALSEDLEVWRAQFGTAWLDSDNSAVYLVLFPGWFRPLEIPAPGPEL